MRKTIKKDISFSLKVQMVQAKMNFQFKMKFQFTSLEPHLSIKIHAPRTHISTRK